MIRSVRAALMRHCHIILLHAAAAAVLLCMVLSALDSRRVRQLKVQEGPSAEIVRNHTLTADIVVADLPDRNKVWLYSLIGADFPGAAPLLEHWLRHYTDLGFRREQMLLVVHTRSNGTTETLERVTEILEGAGVEFERWTGTPYSSDAHLEIKLRLMKDRIQSLQDWIVIADSDEFYDFDALGPGVQEYVSRLEAANASFGAGVLVDRVAEDASLPDVQPTPSLSEQFGLHCAVVRRLTLGTPYRVVAFRAFLRTNTGNHRVVSARTAKTYFGPGGAWREEPQVCNQGGFYGAADLYNLTPYAAHPEKYVRTKQQPRAAGDLWSASLYPSAIAAMHFKWHSGVIQSATERLHYYRGDGGSGKPRYQHFAESERILAMLANSSVPIQNAECKHKMPWRVKRLPKQRKPLYIR